ncbi:hypothetical protein ACOMHN_041198 [Nucella lapillus]
MAERARGLWQHHPGMPVVVQGPRQGNTEAQQWRHRALPTQAGPAVQDVQCLRLGPIICAWRTQRSLLMSSL